VLSKSTHYFAQDIFVKCAELTALDPCGDLEAATGENLTSEKCCGCAPHVLIVLQLSVMSLRSASCEELYQSLLASVLQLSGTFIA
jgi:hypothetical protein